MAYFIFLPHYPVIVLKISLLSFDSRLLRSYASLNETTVLILLSFDSKLWCVVLLFVAGFNLTCFAFVLQMLGLIILKISLLSFDSRV